LEKILSQNDLVAWSGGIVSACGVMGRETESRRDTGGSFREKLNITKFLQYFYLFAAASTTAAVVVAVAAVAAVVVVVDVHDLLLPPEAGVPLDRDPAAGRSGRRYRSLRLRRP
jgi:hypothetical protein